MPELCARRGQRVDHGKEIVDGVELYSRLQELEKASAAARIDTGLFLAQALGAEWSRLGSALGSRSGKGEPGGRRGDAVGNDNNGGHSAGDLRLHCD